MLILSVFAGTTLHEVGGGEKTFPDHPIQDKILCSLYSIITALLPLTLDHTVKEGRQHCIPRAWNNPSHTKHSVNIWKVLIVSENGRIYNCMYSIITTIPLKNYLSNNRNGTLYNKKLFQLPVFCCHHVLFSQPQRILLLFQKHKRKEETLWIQWCCWEWCFKHSTYICDLSLKRKAGVISGWREVTFI